MNAHRNKKSSLSLPEIALILPYFRVFGAGMDWWTTSTASQRERKATLMTGMQHGDVTHHPRSSSWSILRFPGVRYDPFFCQRRLPSFCVTYIRLRPPPHLPHAISNRGNSLFAYAPHCDNLSIDPGLCLTLSCLRVGDLRAIYDIPLCPMAGML